MNGAMKQTKPITSISAQTTKKLILEKLIPNNH
jgi:hypothetical protein